MDGLDLKMFQQNLIADAALFPVYDRNGKLQTTYCNIGARQVAQFLGCYEFDDMELTADLMCQIMRENVSGKWIKVLGFEAQAHAYEGKLAFAAMSSLRMKEAHGHIASVTQDPLQGSGSLGKAVPLVCNIGKGNPSIELDHQADGTCTKPNWICKSSQAFPVLYGEADYFTWNGG